MKRIILCISLLLVCSLVLSETIRGKVISVLDGDTIEILNAKIPLRIRLYAVDCPEKDQDYGTKAKMFTSSLVFGKMVKADIKNMDMYGRSVAEIYLEDGRCLNDELLKNGFAWHYKEYNKEERLSEMELQAREAKLGLWKDNNPIEPWNFRKAKKKGLLSPQRPKMSDSHLKSGAYVASSNSNKFHRSTCKWVKKIAKENRRYFNKKSEAEKEGLEPCSECNP